MVDLPRRIWIVWIASATDDLAVGKRLERFRNDCRAQVGTGYFRGALRFRFSWWTTVGVHAAAKCGR